MTTQAHFCNTHDCGDSQVLPVENPSACECWAPGLAEPLALGSRRHPDIRKAGALECTCEETPEAAIWATFISLIPVNLLKTVSPGTEALTEQSESEGSIPCQQPTFSLSETINFAWLCRPRKVPFVEIEDKGSHECFLSPFSHKKLKEKAHGFPGPSSQACCFSELITVTLQKARPARVLLPEGWLPRELPAQAMKPTDWAVTHPVSGFHALSHH